MSLVCAALYRLKFPCCLDIKILLVSPMGHFWPLDDRIILTVSFKDRIKLKEGTTYSDMNKEFSFFTQKCEPLTEERK
jgi:hypothetical protein